MAAVWATVASWGGGSAAAVWGCQWGQVLVLSFSVLLIAIRVVVESAPSEN